MVVYKLKSPQVHICKSSTIIRQTFRYWVSQKVWSSHNIFWKTSTNFLANPILSKAIVELWLIKNIGKNILLCNSKVYLGNYLLGKSYNILQYFKIFSSFSQLLSGKQKEQEMKKEPRQLTPATFFSCWSNCFKKNEVEAYN